MKCPNCGTNHRKKEGPTCSCGYNFVFNPDNDKGLTDGKFDAVIRAASKEGTYHFTENQLFAAYCRRAAGRGGTSAVIFGLIVLVVVFFWLLQGFDVFSAPGGVNFVAGVFLVVGLVGFVKKVGGRWPKISKTQFHTYLERWRSGGHALDKLLTKPSLHDPPPQWPESDIYDYGVERILIVEHDLMVDELVLNGFHAQEKTLVFSENGYPNYIVERAQDLLKDSPDLPVYYIHDAVPAGTTPPGLAKASGLVGEDRPVVDLGLTEEDAAQIPGLKRVPKEEWGGRVPVDALAFMGLSTLLAAALVEGMAFTQLAAARDAAGADGGVSSFG
ncbi:MAG: hypothetical protein JSV00_05455 [bacterium]|nr:MAG: hypothetical protein JSV00_05455 [bacterium]